MPQELDKIVQIKEAAEASSEKSAQPMDAGDPLDKLLTIGDTGDGWRVVCRLLEAFEHSGCTSP